MRVRLDSLVFDDTHRFYHDARGVHTRSLLSQTLK